MAEETLVKTVCGHHGAMEYERVLELSLGLGLRELSDLDRIIRTSGMFSVVQHGDRKEIIVKSDVRLCKYSECDGAKCGDLHLCKYELMTGHCNRRVCAFRHKLMSDHNIRVLKHHQISGLSREELCVMLLQSDPNLLPPVCVLYNRTEGKCPENSACARLHVCESFVRGRCDVTDCSRSHDFSEPHACSVLKRRGVSDVLMGSIPFIYRNILTLKSHGGPEEALLHQRRTSTESVICLSFVKGFCKNRECSRIHFLMPYKWEVKVHDTWTALPNNEEMEREFCDPSNTNSSGREPVCFEDMTLGLDEVRRLSTEPSVLLPSFVLTTTWIWYWRDEYHHWIQYASVKEMHRMCTVSSDELERRYQEYLQTHEDAVEFRAGTNVYQLNFKDMTQRNRESGTERPVRRRPAFVSSVDVRINKTSRRSSSARPHAYKGVPGFWDQSAIPDKGFQRVSLQSSDRDYAKVQDLFYQTMSRFTITRIERVQNRELWEIFITKKEAMKKANNERFGERLLFHDIRSSHVDVVCLQNFDAAMSDSSMYGKGIYFSKHARPCHKSTEEPVVRRMFLCRVLVGHYTRGDARFHRRPCKNAAGDQYDSCVDYPRDPFVFVLFHKTQIYPEFLVSYEQNQIQDGSRFGSSSGIIQDVTEERSGSRFGSSSGITRDVTEARSGSRFGSPFEIIQDDTEERSGFRFGSPSEIIQDDTEECSGSRFVSPSGIIQDVTEERSGSTLGSSSGITRDVTKARSGSRFGSPSGIIRDVTEARSGSRFGSSSGIIQDDTEARSGSRLGFLSGTIPDVTEESSGSRLGFSSEIIQDVTEALSGSRFGSPSGIIQDVTEALSGSRLGSLSGTIPDVTEESSGSRLGSLYGTIPDVTEERSGSRLGSSSGITRDVTEARSGSRLGSSSGITRDVTEARSGSRFGSSSLSNSSALSSRHTVGSHYHRENSSALRRQSSEGTPRDASTRTTSEGNGCAVM